MSAVTDYLTDLPMPDPAVDSPSAQPKSGFTWIEPASGWQPVNIRELWQYRELLCFLVWRDVKVRYKQTALGAVWAILQPLMMMAVFSIFFRGMAGMTSGDLPYPVFCYLGLLPWTFFSTAISGAGNSIVGSERLITKIYFPRLAVPFGAVGAAVIDFLFALSLVVILMVWYGVHPGWNVLVLPIVFGLVLLLAVGVGTLLAAVNVSYRDFRYVIPFLLQVWMFATPTIYMEPKTHSGIMQALLNLNPMTALVAAFRAASTNNPIPFAQLAVSGVTALVMLCVGCIMFRRAERRFADII